MLPYLNKRSPVSKRKIIDAGSVLGGLSPFILPSLVNRFEIASIVPYDSDPTNPQAQWIDLKSGANLYRPTCAPAPCTPPNLTTTVIGGSNYAIMQNNPTGLFGVEVTHLLPGAGERLLSGATSFTIITYIKDIVGINVATRFILYLNSGSPGTVAPYLRMGIAGASTNMYWHCNDGVTALLVNPGVGDYTIDGSIISLTLDATVGKLEANTYLGAFSVTNGAWNPATQFKGGAAWYHSIFAAGDPAIYLGFDGITSEWYFYNTVLSNATLNKLAAVLANRHGLTLANVWTNLP